MCPQHRLRRHVRPRGGGAQRLRACSAVSVRDLDDQRTFSGQLEAINILAAERNELLSYQYDSDALQIHRALEHASERVGRLHKLAFDSGEPHTHYGIDIIAEQIKFHAYGHSFL